MSAEPTHYRLDVRHSEDEEWREWGSYANRADAKHTAERYITARYWRIVKVKGELGART